MLTSNRHIISSYFLLGLECFMLRLEQELSSTPCLCVAFCRRAQKHFCNYQITTINEQVVSSGSLLSVQTLPFAKASWKK